MPGIQHRENEGNLANMDTLVAGVSVLYVYNRLRYWLPQGIKVINFVFLALITTLGVFAVPLLILKYVVDRFYATDMYEIGSYNNDEFSSLTSYMFWEFVSWLGAACLISNISAMWWASMAPSWATSMHAYAYGVGVLATIISLPLSYPFYTHEELLSILKGNHVDWFFALSINATAACVLIGFIGKKMALKGRDKDEIWFDLVGYDAQRCESFGYDTKDLKTMSNPAREMLRHPVYRTPSAFQVAYYLDFKASIQPVNRNPEEQKDLDELAARIEPYIQKNPWILKKAFAVALIRDPYGNPRMLPDYQRIIDTSKNMSQGEWFCENLYRYVYKPHPLRPKDDALYTLHCNVGKQMTTHFENGYKFADDPKDSYTWVTPQEEEKRKNKTPAIAREKITGFLFAAPGKPHICFKHASDALIFMREHFNAFTLKQERYRVAKAQLENGEEYRHSQFAWESEIVISPVMHNIKWKNN